MLSRNLQEEKQKQQVNENMLKAYQMEAEANELTDPVPVTYKTIFDAQRNDQELREL